MSQIDARRGHSSYAEKSLTHSHTNEKEMMLKTYPCLGFSGVSAYSSSDILSQSLNLKS